MDQTLEVTKKQMDWMKRAKISSLIAISVTDWRAIDVMNLPDKNWERYNQNNDNNNQKK
jgi:hypothetical protein